jgi:hypothetical protein
MTIRLGYTIGIHLEDQDGTMPTAIGAVAVLLVTKAVGLLKHGGPPYGADA